MKKGMFKGWKDVFSFTFVQNTKSKTFKGTVIGIGLLLFVIFFAVNMITGYYKENKKDNKDDSTIDDIEEIIIINETSLDNTIFEEYKDFSQYMEKSELVVEDKISLQEAADDMEDKSGVIVRIYQEEDAADNNVSETYISSETGISSNVIKFMIDVYSTDDISERERERISEEISEYFDSVKYKMLDADDVDNEFISLVQSDIVSYSVDVEEADESLAELLMKIFLPMIFTLVIYMMVLMHGQSISKSLIVEKNSKLMETLLISVKPYAIIFGKILAMYTVAIIQMAIWIASGVLGFVLGDNLATKMYDGYSNPVTDVIKIMREGTTAFTTQSYIMAIIFFAAGFLFYCVLSAFLTSNITKTEELSNGSSIYQIIVAIGYIVSYLIPLMQEKSIVVKILRYIPITSAFMIPADVIVGNIGILGSLISMCILLVTTFIMIIITGKIYKKKVF